MKGAEREPDGIVDGFIQTDHQGYPMLRRGDGTVAGEVYWVPNLCWPDLDDWEEVPEVYQRCAVTLRDGRSAWIYEAAQALNSSIKPKSTKRKHSHCTFTENKKDLP